MATIKMIESAFSRIADAAVVDVAYLLAAHHIEGNWVIYALRILAIVIVAVKFRDLQRSINRLIEILEKLPRTSI